VHVGRYLQMKILQGNSTGTSARRAYFFRESADLSEICIFEGYDGFTRSCLRTRVQVFDILPHVRRRVHSEVPYICRCPSLAAVQLLEAVQFLALSLLKFIQRSCQLTTPVSLERNSREWTGLQQPTKMINFLPACRE